MSCCHNLHPAPPSSCHCRSSAARGTTAATGAPGRMQTGSADCCCHRRLLRMATVLGMEVQTHASGFVRDC